MLGRLHVIPPLFSKVEMEFGTAQDSARDLAEHFGVWLKRGVKKNLLCVFHSFMSFNNHNGLANLAIEQNIGGSNDGKVTFGSGFVNLSDRPEERPIRSRSCKTRSMPWNQIFDRIDGGKEQIGFVAQDVQAREACMGPMPSGVALKRGGASRGA